MIFFNHELRIQSLVHFGYFSFLQKYYSLPDLAVQKHAPFAFSVCFSAEQESPLASLARPALEAKKLEELEVQKLF